MKVTETHVYFWKGFLSQWSKYDMKDSNGLLFNCCEQYMMYQKAIFFNDFDTVARIMMEPNPKKQKDYGRLVRNYDEKEWNEVRQKVVENGNILKFSQNQELYDCLMLTKDRIIVEASPFDIIWGVGLGEDDPLILDEKNWRGQNLLGKALMNVREELRAK